MYIDEIRLLRSRTDDQLKLEYNIVQTLLEFDNINESIFIDMVNAVEYGLMEECTRRFFAQKESEVCDITKLLAVRS